MDALEGRSRTAAATFDAVLAARLAAGDPFTHALITIDSVSVLPADLVPEGAVATARGYLEDLGATPLLARLTAAGARLTPPVDQRPVPAPGLAQPSAQG